MLRASATDVAGASSVSGPSVAGPSPLRELGKDPYLHVADWDLNLISVFDELRYDRADGDFLSTAMRAYGARKLKPLGFRQVSGAVIENRERDVRVLMPKFHALGASPFDAARYTEKRPQDFYLLTPTQTACQFVDHYDTEEAVERIKALIIRHPANLLRLFDFLEDKPAHHRVKEAIGHLKYVQRQAIETEPLKGRRGLG
ncbi:MAG: hypothetical protein OIF40_05550 [Mangrovicoccus sp.]|nr:hypothetical protein [Mangrovicoccus sp.]